MGKKSRSFKKEEKKNKNYCTGSQVAKLRELKAQIKEIEDNMHNHGMNGAAKVLQKELLENMTSAELKFQHIAKLKGIKLIPQFKINIFNKDKSRIDYFYFADFCDFKNKLVFEIDGDYHFTDEQQKKDLKRTKDITKAGFKVFRLTNEDVFNGRTTEFLYKAYLSVGIDILEKK